MSKKSRIRPPKPNPPGKFSRGDLATARNQTIALGIVVILGLSYDGWCVGRACLSQEHLHLPLQIAALPLVVLVFFVISFASWRSMKKAFSKNDGAERV